MEPLDSENKQMDNEEKWLQKEIVKRVFGELFAMYGNGVKSESPKAISKTEKETRALCESLDSSTFEVESWLERAAKFSEQKTNRLVYSIISDFIFGLEQRDRVTTNIRNATNVALEKPENEYSDQNKKMVVKIYDHINLAIRQKEMFDKNEKDLSKEIQDIVENRIEQKSAALTKEMTTQLVSLIAIFTALSFIVFGGISSLDSIFQSLQCVMVEKNTILPTMIVAVAWALCLMNLLFGFMYFVLRITKLHSSEGAKESKNIVQRYPVVFLCDLVLIFLLILFGGMWFAELHGIGKPVFDFVVKHNVVSFWIPIIILLLLFRYAVCKLYEAYFGPAETKCFICKKIRELISGKSNTANTDTQKP